MRKLVLVLPALVALAVESGGRQKPRPTCLGYSCPADAPPALPPPGWVIFPHGPGPGQGGGSYINGILVRTCNPCWPCSTIVDYMYSGSGSWTVEGGYAEPANPCGYELCLSGTGITQNSVTLEAECATQVSMWFSSPEGLGLAVLNCGCAH